MGMCLEASLCLDPVLSESKLRLDSDSSLSSVKLCRDVDGEDLLAT